MDQLIKSFYDPKFGLTSLDRFWTKVKNEYPSIKFKDFKKAIQSQEVTQLHQSKRRPKHFNPIVSPAVNYIWQADLLDVSIMSHKNKGINFILCTIDVMSRYARVQPIKNKTAKSVTDAMSTILVEQAPNVLQCDNGSEFISKQFVKLINEYEIEIEYANPGDHNRQGIVERFNRTLRGYIERYKTAYKTETYIDSLQDFITNYNSSYNRAIDSTPENPDIDKIYEINKEKKLKVKASPFSVGDSVRYIINKTLFSKGAEPKWSKTLHEIESVDGNKFVLENGKSYRDYELQKVSAVETYDTNPINEDISELTEIETKPKRQRRILKKVGIDLNNKLNTVRAKRSKKDVNYVDEDYEEFYQ